MNSKPIFLAHVDSFTAEPFAGNPAGVCVLPAAQPDEWMQAIAREMNLSETAFLLRESDGWRLRWFTPAVEVDLCGHATLASAHILWQVGLLQPGNVACFFTRSGELTARKRGEWIELDFPADAEQPFSPEGDLLKALGGRPLRLARPANSRLDDEEVVRPGRGGGRARPIRGL